VPEHRYVHHDLPQGPGSPGRSAGPHEDDPPGQDQEDGKHPLIVNHCRCRNITIEFDFHNDCSLYMEEERRRSQNKDIKATSIMMELVEIEHSIKIAENGPVSIREVHN
jgi:hypothetical protein